jgi:nucleoside-diphosphate-sugar epimerase
MSRVLVTGANGFLGRYVCPHLTEMETEVIAAVRAPIPDGLPSTAAVRTVGDIGPDTDWREALNGVEAVVHMAARVHIMDGAVSDPDGVYRRTNTEGTTNLARQAITAGVKRFVFISTVKVMGETTPDTPFTETDAPAPEDAYGASKWAAEQALSKIAVATGMEVVVLRPPLVYGARAQGNLLSLLRLCDLAPPLPFATIDNRRSLIYAGNMADAIRVCVDHPAAAGRTYFVRDGEDISIPGLVRCMAAALGRPARLFPLPVAALRLLAALVGKSAAIGRLTNSLRIDDGLIRRELGWTPPVSMIQGMEETAAWYKTRRNP